VGKSDYWKPNDYNALCDVCGWKFKASELKRRWDGLMCCSEDWEPRQPQDFVRGVRDQKKLPFTRPEATDTFVEPGDVKASGYGKGGMS
jgi:hypothetical protein